MRAERPDWSGRTVVCIASGPSLTLEDCEAARVSGHPTIVTNTTFRRCFWAAMLFGYDSRWWKAHIEEVRASGFAGRLLCASPIAGNLGVETVHNAPWLRSYPNSGACSISIAIAARASRIFLLGFDCAPLAGRMHWHDDHPPAFGMTNCASISASVSGPAVKCSICASVMPSILSKAFSAHFPSMVGSGRISANKNCKRPGE